MPYKQALALSKCWRLCYLDVTRLLECDVDDEEFAIFCVDAVSRNSKATLYFTAALVHVVVVRIVFKKSNLDDVKVFLDNDDKVTK
jgi:hypothetical protein